MSRLSSLPPEIRLMIYNYVLEPEPICVGSSTLPRVHRIPGTVEVHTYRFHVPILFTNKEIYREARACLYKKHHFVSCSLQWPDIDRKRELWHVPIIRRMGFRTEQNRPKYAHLSAHISMVTDRAFHEQYLDDAFYDTENCYSISRQSETPEQRGWRVSTLQEQSGLFYLMLAKDFVKLCQVMSIDLHSYSRTANYNPPCTVRCLQSINHSLTTTFHLVQEMVHRFEGLTTVVIIMHNTPNWPAPGDSRGYISTATETLWQQPGKPFAARGTILWHQDKLDLAASLKVKTDALVTSQLTIGNNEIPSAFIKYQLCLRFSVLTKLLYSAMPGDPNNRYSAPAVYDLRAVVRRIFLAIYDCQYSAILLEIRLHQRPAQRAVTVSDRMRYFRGIMGSSIRIASERWIVLGQHSQTSLRARALHMRGVGSMILHAWQNQQNEWRRDIWVARYEAPLDRAIRRDEAWADNLGTGRWPDIRQTALNDLPWFINTVPGVEPLPLNTD